MSNFKFLNEICNVLLKQLGVVVIDGRIYLYLIVSFNTTDLKYANIQFMFVYLLKIRLIINIVLQKKPF